jgi:hypothetical protein
MVALLGGVAVLAGFGASGVAFLRRASPALDPIERLVYGIPLGWVLASLAILLLACVFGLHPWLVVVVAGMGTVPFFFQNRVVRDSERKRGQSLFAAIVIGALVLRWLLFWNGAFTIDAQGLWTSQKSLWGDAAQHLGDTASFAYGDNFPPLHPRYPGAPFNYHYLTSVTSACLVELGLTPWAALGLHSFLGCVLIALGVYRFGRRLGLSEASAATALVLLVLGGGFGWWTRLTGQEVGNLRWLNVFFALLSPQRGLMYGVPLGLLALTLIRLRSFVLAGIVAGLLPYAHLGTLLSFAMLTPCLFLLFPERRWIGFFAAWALVAGPQVLVQQAGSAGAASAMRFLPGWVAAPDQWLLFWLKNLGLFLPLLLAAVQARTILPEPSRRFLLAFQPLFVVSNLFIFQPWDWDNTKVLFWWFLASCFLVAALLARLWDLGPRFLVRPALAVLVLSMIGSGLIENADQARGKQRNLLLTTEEIDFARRVRESTDPHALFVTGLKHNHPVSVLAGRRVLMGYTGWLWSQGIDFSVRERDVRSIMKLAPDADALLARYGVAYVVIGPDERENLAADPDAWREHYPSVLRTASYELFSVAPSRGATTSTTPPRE